jgi:hypothetical protein
MKKIIRRIFAIVMSVALVLEANVVSYANEADSNDTNVYLQEIIDVINSDSGELSVMFDENGYAKKEYTIQLSNGEIVQSTISIEYVSPKMAKGNYDPYEGSVTAPSINSSIRFDWSVTATSSVPGFDFITTIKRTGTNSIEATSTEIHVSLAAMESLDSSDSWICTSYHEYVARTKASFSCKKSFISSYISVSLTADFVMENGKIGFYMWQNT